MNKTMELRLRKEFEKMYSEQLSRFAEQINSATRFLMMKHPEGVKSTSDGICFEMNNLSKDELETCSKIEELLNMDIAFYLELKSSEEVIKIINGWFQEDLLKKLGDQYGMKDYWFSWDSESYDIDFDSWDPSRVEIIYH